MVEEATHFNKLQGGRSVLPDIALRRSHIWIYIVGALGYFFDAFDVLLASYVIPLIGQEWNVAPSMLGWFATVGFLGMAVGGILFGSLGDLVGRKKAFIGTIFLYSVFSLLCAAAPNVTLLFLFRFIAGVGLGGCLPVDMAMLSEFMPPKYRGKLIAFLGVFWVGGATTVGFVSAWLSPFQNFRLIFLAAGLPVLLIFFIRLAIPESPLYLYCKGKVKEANVILRKVHGIEMDAGQLFEHNDSGAGFKNNEKIVKGLFASLLKVWRFNPGITLMVWYAYASVLFIYYGVILWLPKILIANGYKTYAAFLFTSYITLIGLLGVVLCIFLVDKMGRKWSLALSFIFMGVALFAFAFTLHAPTSSFILLGTYMFFESIALAILYVYIPECYPTLLRVSGFGWATAITRITSDFSPLVFAAIWGKLGLVNTMSIAMITLAIAGVLILRLGKETKGHLLS
ncbi:MFS transporter [Metabacillus sp. RGM 3146]|uniref:MFS transporter n=1 Tax=Metabacillus sp. RGM 3146 TaxID=3401092 RepID=UPI003B9B407A